MPRAISRTCRSRSATRRLYSSIVPRNACSCSGVAIELSKSDRKAWPSAVGVRDNAVYRVSDNLGAVVDVRLRTVPAGTLSDLSSARSLAALVERECFMQAAPAMRQVMQAREQI